jgi:phage terminase large subunit
VLEDERKLDLAHHPERYDHIWEGSYARAFEGAYFARCCRRRGRRGGSARSPPIHCCRCAPFDIGGSGAATDAFPIWISQWGV